MKKYSKQFFLLFALMIAVLSLTACSKKDEDSLDYISMNVGNKPLLTIAELKAEFDESSSSSSYMFKPFYNVSQTTEFTFHFNSTVDPIKSITVHTDPKCEDISTIYQTNYGYRTESGVDIVVRPPNSPVLDSDKREDHDENKNCWGYAPIYYICVRYDLDAPTAQKLEEPIVIPFTVKQEISTPNAYANIDENGNFSIKWDSIPGATSYKVYSSGKSSSRDANRTISEYGYVGEFLYLKATLDSDVTKYEAEKPYVDSYGNAMSQNYTWGNSAYYVTAVDKDGNESFFSRPVCSWHYTSILPYKVDSQNLGINERYYFEEFLDRVNVTSIDRETLISYPINYTKTGNPFNHKCEYEYKIAGTMLGGSITYYNENDEFPETYISNYNLQRVELPDVPKENVIPTDIDIFVDNDYSNSIIDISSSTTYPDGARILFDPGNLYLRTDIEVARLFTGGVYSTSIDTIDSFVATENPKYIAIKENGTIVVREATPEDFENKNNEYYNYYNVIREKAAKGELTDEPAKEINSNNFVDEQRKSTTKQVATADKETIVGTNYPVFAETAGQKYLALKMINQEEEISLKAFPAYQDADQLFDDMLYVWYQNPYIMGIDPNECRYDYNNQTLYVDYNLDKQTAEKEQEAVYKKSQEVIKEIIKPNMSAEEKVMAIWEYIEDNSEYNMDAYNSGISGSVDFYKEFGNSWNTYGILCENKGVCQSYSYTFKLLAELSGLEAVVVTGTMNNGGHAWNAVKLDGNWYMIDLTNNTKALDGLAYWICNASTEFIQNNGFVLNDLFVHGTDISEFVSSDNTKDWYYENELMPSNVAECAKMWMEKKDESNTILVKYHLATLDEKRSFWSTFKAEAEKLGATEDELNSWKILEYSGILIIQKR